MKFLYAIVITQLGAAWVLPSQLEKSQVYDPCPDISYDDAYCCAAGPLDDDIDCDRPSIIPTGPSDFESTCAFIGKRARCCRVPILGYNWFICQVPAGVSPYRRE